MFYKDGVFDGNCKPSINHAVLTVGYGSMDGMKYWKVKNSWGEDWGEKGYFRLLKDTGEVGRCGIAQIPSYPLIAN